MSNFMVEKNDRNGLLCPNNFLSVGFELIASKNPCSAKIWYFGVHLIIQQHIACFHISMDDFEPRVFVQV